MSLKIFDDSLPVWQKVKEREEKETKELEVMNEEEFRKAVAKSQAKAHAETWCRCYGLPVEAIEETENSFIFKVEFKF